MIIVDVETSGTNPDFHSLLSIGAIDFDNPKNTFHIDCSAFEGAHIDTDALKINGFTPERVFDSSLKTDKEALLLFMEWLKTVNEHTIGGQNPFFDVSFLLKTSERYHLNLSLAHRIIDLHSIVYYDMIKKGITPPQANGRTDLNSDKIMNYVGLPAEPKPHIALNGAKWEAEAFSRLLYGKVLFEEFKNNPIPWKN